MNEIICRRVVWANDPKLPATTWLDKSEVGSRGRAPHPFTLDVVLYVMQSGLFRLGWKLRRDRAETE